MKEHVCGFAETGKSVLNVLSVTSQSPKTKVQLRLKTRSLVSSLMFFAKVRRMPRNHLAQASVEEIAPCDMRLKWQKCVFGKQAF